MFRKETHRSTKETNQSNRTMSLEQWKIDAQLPPSAKFYNWLAISSPLLWWRCAWFKKIPLQPVFNSILAIVVPSVAFYTLTTSNQTRAASSTIATPRSIVVAGCCYGAWCLGWTYHAGLTISKVVATIHEFCTSHSLAKPSAWECLASRIRSGRAHRCSTYDVYLPPSQQQDATPPTPVLFFPGFSVEHTAYAQPAALLSDRGYLVVVVSGEPANLIDMWVPRFWPSNLRRLQRTVERQYFSNARQRPKWILMGHSMGSLLCTRLAARWKNTNTTLCMVLWGSPPFNDFVDEHIPKDLPTLVVQATEDVVISTFSTAEAEKEYWRRLPPNAVLSSIESGLHSGFGSYTTNWKAEVDGIPTEEQHQKAVAITDDFVRGLS